MTTKFPIVLDRWEICTGKCARKTWHRAVIYPEFEDHSCNECGHKKHFGFGEEHNPEHDWAVEYRKSKEVMRQVAGDLTTHKWSKGMGRKDKNFIQRIIEVLIGKPSDEY